jgi:enoyl-CoA hydratase
MSGTTATARVGLETREGGVRVIRLADPAHRNAIDRTLRDELARAVGAVARDDAARVLVLTADGPDFCSGAELIDTFDNAAARPAEELRADLLKIYDSFLALRALPIPTIAAVRGQAVGAGANLAFSCDVRIAAPDAKFAMVFTKIGLHPGGGASYYLAKMLGRERALRVLLDGETLDAQAALRAGVVSQVADDAEVEALAMASRWAALEPDVARSIKRAIDIALDEGFAPSLDFESRAQTRSAQRPQIQEAVERLRARRQGRP